MAGPRDDLKAELRTHLDTAATKVGSVTAALDASVIVAALDEADQEIRESILLVDGLSALRVQVPGMDKRERALEMPERYSQFRSFLGAVHSRLLAAVDAIDNPPAPP